MTTLNYTNSESAKTRLRLGLAHNFKKITRDNGYNHDMGDVWHGFVEPGKITNYPAVVLIMGPSRTLNEDVSDQLLHKQINVMGMAYLRENEDADLARERFLCDIETMIGRNYTLQGEDGYETCMVCWVAGDEPFGTIANKPQIGFAFRIDIRMRQDFFDATVIG